MAAAEVNGSSAPAKEEEEPMDVTTPHTENYQTLIDAGLPQKVAESLDNIFQTGGWCLFFPQMAAKYIKQFLTVKVTVSCNCRFGGICWPGWKGYWCTTGIQWGGSTYCTAAIQRERFVSCTGNHMDGLHRLFPLCWVLCATLQIHSFFEFNLIFNVE